ncbi:MAG TPA: type II toxin-antitoxin system prevent-host-death family antitoxin [Terriglobia bacterium]|nr:type II toxin-antitoxin system prevent-host-death family antitoxin [Terriglobia bacterium]
MTIGIFEAKQKLSQLVERASRGEEIVITRRGREQARLVPMPAVRARTLKEIFDSIRSRPPIKLGRGITIKGLIEEGRQF